jgi:hypothetical protein
LAPVIRAICRVVMGSSLPPRAAGGERRRRLGPAVPLSPLRGEASWKA